MTLLRLQPRERPSGAGRVRSRGSSGARLLLAILAAAVTLARAQGPVVDEYKVKAAFAVSFAKFVEWPESSVASAAATFRLGILGTDPFGDALAEVVRGKKLHGLPVEVVRGGRLSDLGNCDVLFIAASETVRLQKHLSDLSGVPVLTVSDGPGFAKSGGMIGLCLEEDRVYFEVNLVALGQAGLEVSSRLLALARDIIGERTAEDP